MRGGSLGVREFGPLKLVPLILLCWASAGDAAGVEAADNAGGEEVMLEVTVYLEHDAHAITWASSSRLSGSRNVPRWSA
jgi:hypothetical protein